jgi:hypothetical protein
MMSQTAYARQAITTIGCPNGPELAIRRSVARTRFYDPEGEGRLANHPDIGLDLELQHK